MSPGTASRVLSGSSYPVSLATRRQVEDAARSLNYVASSVARALVTGRTALLAAIVHDITDPFFSAVVRSLQDSAAANGLVVLVGNDDRDAEKLAGYLKMMLSQQPAGVILVGGQLRDPATTMSVTRAVQRLVDQGIPVVAVGRYELDIPHVEVDNEAAANEAVAHLLGRGHRRIAFVGGPLNNTTVQDRYAGYAAALGRAAIPLDELLVVQTEMTVAGGSEAAHRLVASGADFTAAFAASDEVAYGLVSAVRGRGLAVPGDVSIVGFNDVPMSAHIDPPLTTVRVPTELLGSAAWRLLVSEHENRPTAPVLVPFELVVRASTAPFRPRR